MKKIVSTLAVSLLLLSAVIGQGIEFFHGSWEEALAEAKKQEKPIFVDAFTTWCGPVSYTHLDVYKRQGHRSASCSA